MHRRRKYHKRGNLFPKVKKQTISTVAAIWMWLIAGAVFLSFFGEGTVLTKLQEGLYTRLGWGMYPLPVFLVSLSLLFFKIKSDLAKPNIPMGFGILLLALIGLTQAGTIGEWLMYLLSEGLSFEGAVILFLGVFIIGLLLLFNASLDAFMNTILTFFERAFHVFGEWFNSLGDAKGKNMKKFAMKGMIGDDEQMTKKTQIPLFNPPQANSTAQTKPILGTNGQPLSSELKIPSPLTAPTQETVWEYPPISLLSDVDGSADRGDVKKNGDTIERTLESFGITARIAEVNKGPAVTQYALRIALGTKVSRIAALTNDLALALAAPTGQVRIETPIPGRDLVGIEIPNRGLEFVTLKRMLSSESLMKAKSKLQVALGFDVSGTPVSINLGKMPHVLIAGTTGSGKSVLVNSFICSLLFRTTPQEVRLIMVDPKRVELTGYNGIPHLLTPVIVDADKALSALHFAVGEMEKRYKQFAEVGAKNIDAFNELSGFQAMPYILIFIDELATLMAYAPADAEDSICKIAQMSRAVGIHLILATQRPSVDVITGLIKANIPSRIAFNVSSMIDSRVIIDGPGAEKLLGRGDMLYIPPDQSKPTRIQGTYVGDQDVVKVVEFLKNKNAPVHYTEEVVSTPVSVGGRKGMGATSADGRDPLFEDAFRLFCQYDKASASLLQRRLSVGYARAARILDQLEQAGIIGPDQGAKGREVRIKNPDEYYAQQQQQTT